MTTTWRAFLTPDEMAALTRANPKGKLLEFCARARCGPPVVEVERGVAVFAARMTLSLDGRGFDSGRHWAGVWMMAEQLAARALLEAIAHTEEDAESEEWVAEEEETRLRQENPKGTLLERCARLRLTPRLEVRPIVTREGAGFEASAFVEAAGDEVWSDLRRARQAKTAEQAAAASLLLRLDQPIAPSPTRSLSAEPPEPRGVLNELWQRGQVRDYGFALERIAGPPHAPIFYMAGFAERRTGERVEVTGVEAMSKKEGERRVAERLLAQL
jgi:hypothetical protein